jgi:purine-nucleoside phosphorylase
MGSDALGVSAADLEAARRLCDDGDDPSVGLILGSGLSLLAERIADRRDLDYDRLPGYPKAGEVAGHAGQLSVGYLEGVRVLAFRGRRHRYQGVSARDAAYPARLAAALGCRRLVVTNAAGGLSPSLGAGDVMLITDHLNLTGDSPLVGWPGPSGGTPFVPMGDAYDPELGALARDVAAEQGLDLTEGVYAGLLGPQYETPAEVEMLRRLGADAVGMSTVPEVIAARALELSVLGISLITNVAGGSDLSHDEVLEVGAKAADSLADLVIGILGRLER